MAMTLYKNKSIDKKVRNVPLVDEIKRNIDQADVISFDVFDTLLFRPYLKPTDLFLHLEKITQCPGFADARIQAEHAARQAETVREDITLNAIYQQIADPFKSLQQAEIEFELQVLSQNSEMKQVWDYAKAQGKQIIIISDMYLPASIIAQALAKNGFADYQQLYVSSELGKTKHSGALYQHIMQQLQLAPAKILHIGDNKHADYQQAKQQGITAVLYQQLSAQFLAKNKRLQQFHKLTQGTLAASILISLLALRWQKNRFSANENSYWQTLGYEYAGPVAYGYSRWIESVAQELQLTQLLFVARDGYTLQKIFATFNSSISTHYVYASRFLSLICQPDCQPEEKERIFALVEFYCQKDPQLAALFSELRPTEKNRQACYYQFINQHKDLFRKNAQTEWDNYKNYLQNTINNATDNLGSVDTLSGKRLSSLNLLQNTLNTRITGLYWSLADSYDQQKYQIRQFIPNYKKVSMNSYAMTKNWDFMEFLLTAPELPIKMVTADGKPVYTANPPQAEIYRKNIYPEIAQGALEFAAEANRIFGGKNTFFTSAELIHWVNCFCDYPDRQDIRQITKIQHASDNSHEKYQNLFILNIPFSLLVRHPYRALKMAKNVNPKWRSTPQRISVWLFYPVRQIIRAPFQLVKQLIKRLFSHKKPLPKPNNRN